MKIKLTQRGRFVVYSLLIMGIFAAVGFAVFVVAQVSQYDYNDHAPKPIINCVQDTVLQPDGSCAPMEK